MIEFWFESDGTRLFAVEDGSGEVVVLLHGGMASHVAALPLLEPLSTGFRVIAPDLRGSGRSWCGEELGFDRLADDVVALLDHLGVDRAVVGGVSGGSGVAVRFALRWPGRLRGLIVARPVYAGEDKGYSRLQQETFADLDKVASRALDEGVAVLRPLYESLPEPMRQKAFAMLEEFDPASVVATSRFVASGAQPLRSALELRSIAAPSLLVRGDDPLHPGKVSELYASNLPNCTVVPAATTEVAAAIADFLTNQLRA